MKKKITQISFVLLIGLAMFSCDKGSKEASSDAANASTAEASANTDAQAASATPADQTSTDTLAGYGEFKFEETEFNFGNIKMGDKVKHTFKFTNVGKAPLKIQKVSPSCGCTAANYSKEAVAPGGEGFIELEFNSEGKPGAANKQASIDANVKGEAVTLKLIGHVEDTQSLPNGPVRQ